MADSSSVPGMFARLYTAPPENVLWDMYENETSFEDAMAKSSDMSSLLGYAGVEDDLFEFTDEDIFSAMYQAQVANNQGISPDEVMRTPWGPGLSGEELDDLFDEYPGAKVGLDLDRFEEILEGAEEFLGFAGDDIQEIMDSMADAAESEGRIGDEGSLWERLGDQVGDAFRAFAGPDLLRTSTDYSESILKNTLDEMKNDWEGPLGRTGEIQLQSLPPLDPGEGEAFDPLRRAGEIQLQALPPSGYGKENLSDTVEAMKETFGPGIERVLDYIGWPSRPGSQERLQAAFEKPGFIDKVQTAVFWGDFGPLFSFMEKPEPEYDVELDAMLRDNPDPATLARQLRDEGVTAEEIEEWRQFSPVWKDREFKLPLSYYKDGELISSTTPATSGEYLDQLMEDYSTVGTVSPHLRGGPLGGDDADRVSGFGPGKPRVTVKKEEEPVVPSGEQPKATKADTGILTAQNAMEEDLRAKFYAKVYAQPGAGRADVQRHLWPLFAQSRTLFFLANGLGAWGYQIAMLEDGSKERLAGESQAESVGITIPDVSQVEAKNILEESYDTFLGEFLSNPSQYRSGVDFRNKVDRVNGILTKFEENPDLQTWKSKDVEDYIWINGLFGETDFGKSNRGEIIKMQVTGGGTGIYSQAINSSIDKVMQYYENIGWSQARIFSQMTSILGRKDVAKEVAKTNVENLVEEKTHDPNALDAEIKDFEQEYLSPVEQMETGMFIDPPAGMRDAAGRQYPLPGAQIGTGEFVDPPAGMGTYGIPPQYPSPVAQRGTGEFIDPPAGMGGVGAYQYPSPATQRATGVFIDPPAGMGGVGAYQYPSPATQRATGVFIDPFQGFAPRGIDLSPGGFAITLPPDPRFPLGMDPGFELKPGPPDPRFPLGIDPGFVRDPGSFQRFAPAQTPITSPSGHQY